MLTPRRRARRHAVAALALYSVAWLVIAVGLWFTFGFLGEGLPVHALGVFVGTGLSHALLRRAGEDSADAAARLHSAQLAHGGLR